ncbi:MAG: hypothetical protein IPK80_25510 [Nannocystis sp.]|nr:hypothetical protein [Nannocystis sp.]
MLHRARPHHHALPLLLAAACGWNDPDYVYDTDTTSSSSSGASSTTTDASTTADATTDATTTEATTDAATTAETTGDDTTDSGQDQAVCAAAAPIALIDPTAEPQPAPWLPGGSIEVGVTLHNTGGADFSWYPGIEVSADHPLVTSGAPANWLYAIFAGMKTPIAVVFTADPAIEPGTLVTFTIRGVVLGKQCEGLAETTVQATVTGEP